MSELCEDKLMLGVWLLIILLIAPCCYTFVYHNFQFLGFCIGYIMGIVIGIIIYGLYMLECDN